MKRPVPLHGAGSSHDQGVGRDELRAGAFDASEAEVEGDGALVGE